MNVPRILIGLLAVVVVGGCSRKPKDETVINTMRAVLEENAEAMKRHDLEGVMATIHPDSPVYAETRNAMARIIDLPLVITLEKMDVTTADSREARVDYVQVTQGESEQVGFRPNRISGTHILRPDADGWKIYDTRIRKIDFLDGGPGGTN